MLLIWLFGVGVGIANACVASDFVPAPGSGSGHEADANGPRHDTPKASSASLAEPGLTQTQAGTQDESSCHPRTTCADYCDKSSLAMAQPKSKVGAAQGFALPTAASAVVVPVHPFEPLPLRAPRQDGVRTALSPITLLRLAL